jgi:hypothetical protein
MPPEVLVLPIELLRRLPSRLFTLGKQRRANYGKISQIRMIVSAEARLGVYRIADVVSVGGMNEM